MNYIMAILLAMLLTGCTSTKIVSVKEVYIPELTFPIFPDLYGDVRNPDDSVNVPGEWLIQLREFEIFYEETKKNYRNIKRIFKEAEK